MAFCRNYLGVFIMLMSINSIADSLKKNETESIERIELSAPDWQVVNDSVMGGLSVGDTEVHEDSFVFSGDISIENNGGFSSVYRPVSELSNSLDSISVRVVGDGKLYQLRIRCQVDGYNLAYKLGFYTERNIEQSLTFPLSDFEASFRGRLITGAPQLQAKNITHVGFLITDKQPVNFSLKVTDISFYSSKAINE
jgi:Complex I intermediate-associated protein 30 (CIA30)